MSEFVSVDQEQYTQPININEPYHDILAFIYVDMNVFAPFSSRHEIVIYFLSISFIKC